DALLRTVPPDEMRNVVDIRSCAGRDRRETHGRERGEDGRAAPVVAVRSEECERRRAPALGRALEGVGRHPVDDDENGFLGRHSLVPGERAQPGVSLGLAAPQTYGERGKRERL